MYSHTYLNTAHTFCSPVREKLFSAYLTNPLEGNRLIHHCKLFLIAVSNDLLMDKVKSITSFYI